MKKFSEISIIRLQTAYLFTEDNRKVRKLCPSLSKELKQENIEMVFVPEDKSEDAVLLETDDIRWFNPVEWYFDYEIDSDSVVSEVEFYRTDMDKELIMFLDCKIGQRMLVKQYDEEELKDMYFYVEGIIFPATENNNEPSIEHVQIYNIREDRFMVPEKFEGGYYLENDSIEDAPFELWPIIKEMASENETV